MNRDDILINFNGVKKEEHTFPQSKRFFEDVVEPDPYAYNNYEYDNDCGCVDEQIPEGDDCVEEPECDCNDCMDCCPTKYCYEKIVDCEERDCEGNCFRHCVTTIKVCKEY